MTFNLLSAIRLFIFPMMGSSIWISEHRWILGQWAAFLCPLFFNPYFNLMVNPKYWEQH